MGHGMKHKSHKNNKIIQKDYVNMWLCVVCCHADAALHSDLKKN